MRTRRSDSNIDDRRPKTLVVLGVLILLGLGATIFVQYELSAPSPGSSKTVRVEIPNGAGSVGIAQTLATAGLVHSSWSFLAAVALNHSAGTLKAGTYALAPSMSAQRIMTLLAEGKTDSADIVVPEGFTAAQVGSRLASKQLVDRLAFIQEVATQGESYYFADGFAPPRSLEGYLFPLTYNVVRGSSPHAIVGQMVDAFDSHIVRRHPEVRDWHSVVIVASLVEREAKVDSDRPLIASVYYNRLQQGMPLQCDATVQYALPEHKARLMYSDLRIESPYNTYLHRGLPPGPICNPGEASIEAAINPAQTNYLFYVAGPGGAHIFSRTLAEQDKAIALVRGNT